MVILSERARAIRVCTRVVLRTRVCSTGSRRVQVQVSNSNGPAIHDMLLWASLAGCPTEGVARRASTVLHFARNGHPRAHASQRGANVPDEFDAIRTRDAYLYTVRDFYPRRSAHGHRVASRSRQMGKHGVRGQKQASKQRGGLPRHTDGRETGRETEGRPTGQLSKTRGKLGSLEARSLSGPSWSDTWTPGDSGQADRTSRQNKQTEQADRTSRQQTAARRNNPPSGNPDAAPGGALLSRIQSPTAQPLRVPVCHTKGDLPDSEYGLTSDATWPVFPLPGQIGL